MTGVPTATAQKRIRRDNSGELLEGFASECSCLHAQPTPLLIGKSEPTAIEVFLVHPDLFDEIVDDLLLIPVDPAGYKQDEEAWIV